MTSLAKHITFFFLLISFAGQSQTSVPRIHTSIYSPRTTTVYYKLGESIIPLKLLQYGDMKDVVYINLHADEFTSIQAAQSLLEKEGGYMIKIENNNKRNIRFRLKGKYYTFDPNRIFSRDGICQTLKIFNCMDEAAINEVEKFAARLLDFIPQHVSCVVALHNNTDGKFGINSYLPGADHQYDAKLVYANPSQDPDDIFLTTDSILYTRLAAEKYNTIWQDNDHAHKDGSLSIYCGEKDIPYVNCETEHGRTSQYYSMLVATATHIERLNPEVATFSYRIESADNTSKLNEGHAVYFGEKRIGRVKTVNNDSYLSGRVEIDRDFRIYSNMDFFLAKVDDESRIELRIDPTREKKLLHPSRNIIKVQGTGDKAQN